MLKGAFVVDSNFFTHHVGVRNYVLSLQSLISPCASVEFLASDRASDGSLQWFTMTPLSHDPAFLSDDTNDAHITGSPKEVMKSFKRLSRQRNKNFHSSIDIVFTQIGTRFPVDLYDFVFVTVPWLDLPATGFSNNITYGLVYDLIPNKYSITSRQPPFDFAAAHQRGYAWYERNCDVIFSISNSTAKEYLKFYRPRGQVCALGPIPPASYDNRDVVKEDRNRSVVLSAPFDPRKGLYDLPLILNSVSDKIEHVFVYGAPRCSLEDVSEFFKGLRVEEITWVPWASINTVKRAFSDSRLLVFPSHDEGLGLPLLEAQWLGCRVACRNIEPLRSIALQGSILLQADDNEDYSQRISNALDEDGFDHVDLAMNARLSFRREVVLSQIRKFFP